MLNQNLNAPQYDRSSLVQAQPLVEPLIPEVIDPDDEVISTAPTRSQNCKLLTPLLFQLLFYLCNW